MWLILRTTMFVLVGLLAVALALSYVASITSPPQVFTGDVAYSWDYVNDTVIVSLFNHERLPAKVSVVIVLENNTVIAGRCGNISLKDIVVRPEKKG